MLETTLRQQALRTARDLAAAAAGVLSDGFRLPTEIGFKREADLVTEYDRRCEQLIVDGLAAAFPTHAVLAEEGGQRPPPQPPGPPAAGSSAARWLVDPLDGTTNFAHGLPLFVVSIALEVDGELEVGVVRAPLLDWEFWAARGSGAFLERGGASERLRVSQVARLEHGLLVTGFPYDGRVSAANNIDHFRAFQHCTQGVRRLGSAALDLCLLAQGCFDGYWEMKLNPWDLAAAALISREAGATVTRFDGSPLVLDRGEILASNGLIHEEMIGLLGYRQ